jgi:anti-sigma B factor antagonist
MATPEILAQVLAADAAIGDAPVALKLVGRLDGAGGDWLTHQVERLKAGSASNWILDMTQVEFIDSAGLVALVATLQAAATAEVEVCLCGLNAQARLILDITQLDQVFQVVDSIETLFAPNQSLQVIEMDHTWNQASAA